MSSSGGEDAEEGDEVCANCGKAAVDNIKLKLCTACKLVKYCSVECQKDHRSQHEKAYKKRVAEIRDNDVFRQPEISHLGECPICCLPLPLDEKKSSINTCCSKMICAGCAYANLLRERGEGLEPRCPYCREPIPKTDEEETSNQMKRVKANDPVAIYEMGRVRFSEGDYDGAIQYYTKAAKLGDDNAHFSLSLMYRYGDGVSQDKKQQLYHLEEASIGGHHLARYNLGSYELDNGRIERAKNHFIIGANLGDDKSLNAVKEYF